MALFMIKPPTLNLRDDLTVKSITSRREMTYKDLNDFDGMDQSLAPVAVTNNGDMIGSFNVYRGFNNEQFSQEIQVIGTDDIVDYVVGLYYLNEISHAENNFDITNTAPVPVVHNRYGVEGDSIALFGQADWKMTDALTLTTGLRFTRESKEVYMQHSDGVFSLSVPMVKEKDHWSSVTPMIALSYLWENGVNTYVKIAQGWKSGGFNGEAGPSFSGLTAEQVFRQSYDPEKVTSYELGMKARWWDNRIQTNLALFHNDIKDMQVSNLGNPAVYSSITNAGKAVMQGVELDGAVQIVRGLSLTGSYSYLKTKYKKYDAGFYGHNLAGLPEAVFPYAPKQSASVGIDYKVNVGVGDLTARMDYSVVGAHSIFDNPINAAVTRVKRFGLLNGRVALAEMNVGDKQTLEVGFWGKNLTNEEYRINGLPVVDGTNSVVGGANYYGDPRTFGADVTYKW
jgi:iron complex outermembrane recepter protein